MFKTLMHNSDHPELQLKEIDIDWKTFELYGACPTQADFLDIDGDSYYFRFRHGHASLECNGKSIAYGEFLFDGGLCNKEDMEIWLIHSGIFIK